LAFKLRPNLQKFIRQPYEKLTKVKTYKILKKKCDCKRQRGYKEIAHNYNADLEKLDN